MSDYADGPRLLADIGGTNARFALETAPGRIEAVNVLACDDYASLQDAMQAYCARVPGQAIRHAAVAIANPVDGDMVHMTNRDWRFSIAAMRSAMHFDTLLVMNDFVALAMALPHLGAGQLRQIGPGTRQPGRAIGLLGPGTGLGVAGMVQVEGRWVPLASEGGHSTFAPADATEIALLQRLLESHAHVSCERVLSGAGLESIYQILTGHALSAAEITAGALDGTSLKCTETVERFCAILGTVAGNVALTLCATGGVFIGGGIVPRFGDILARSRFRARFEGKGRMQAMLGAVPTYLITERYPAFAGIASMLADHLGKKN
jgi:glucokinase